MNKVIKIAVMAAVAMGLSACAHTYNTSTTVPPHYLSVKHWKQCTATKNMGTYRAVCLPMNRPRHCPHSAWMHLQGDDTLPACSK